MAEKIITQVRCPRSDCGWTWWPRIPFDPTKPLGVNRNGPTNCVHCKAAIAPIELRRKKKVKP
jgi:hypothetical protein